MAPVRLTVHLVLALLLYAAVLWTALSLLPPIPRIAAAPGLRLWAMITLILIGSTIAAGGLVAGLHAGFTYNTFPLMDGRLVPAGYADLSPFGLNFIANIAAVQFDHRVLATLTLLATAWLLRKAWPHRAVLGWRIPTLGVAIALQYALGVTTLLLAVPIDLAIAHQGGATLLLTAALLLAHAIRPYAGMAHGQPARHTPSYPLIVPPSSAEETAQ